MAVLVKSFFALSVALALAACAAQSEAQQPTVRTVWLMGEVHDNPQAHQARYEIIANKVKAQAVEAEIVA